MAKKHKGGHAAETQQKSHRRFGHGRKPAVVEQPGDEGRGGPVPGQTDFSAPEEQAMRAGMRNDRGAPPTDGSAPPIAGSAQPPQAPGAGGGDGDFDDL